METQTRKVKFLGDGLPAMDQNPNAVFAFQENCGIVVKNDGLEYSGLVLDELESILSKLFRKEKVTIVVSPAGNVRVVEENLVDTRIDNDPMRNIL